jgi:hypothetical protein
MTLLRSPESAISLIAEAIEGRIVLRAGTASP